MKRKVCPPDILANFRWHSRFFDFGNNFYFNTHIFSTLNFFFGTTVIAFLIGFRWPWFWALAFSFSTYMVYAWFRTKRLAYGLHVKRKFSPRGRENEDFEIHYDISNETGFALPGFTFRQPFTGVQEGSFAVKTPGNIPAQTKQRITVKAKLNAGMGVKEMGGFTLHVHDELSLFPYRVEFSGTEEVEVFPLIIETPQLKKSISPDSTEFGFYDIQKRGESNLFIGTREYRHGDPVRHINWKLSRKTSKLIVNEFEKNTNTYVTLLLDLELNSQVGFGSLSTWEAAKDLALSIAANEIRQRNYVQVLAQDLFLPFGTGESQMQSLERHFTYHELSSKGPDHLKHLQHLPSNSQIYFFCPMLATANVMETIRFLKQLRLLGHHITIFGIDPYQETRKAVTSGASTPITIAAQEARKQFEVIGNELRSTGVNFAVIDVREKVSLREMVRTRARHILEERFS